MKKKFWLGSLSILVCVLAGGAFIFISNDSTLSENTTGTLWPERELPGNYTEYRSGRYGFSVLYPKYLQVREEEETATSRSIIFEDKETEAGFQVFVVYYPFDSIDEERFLLDVPSGVRLHEEAITVSGIPAVQFFSQDASLGETREIWFIHNDYLFEVTTYQPLDLWFKDIIATWLFVR